ncbi:MAG TPA: peptide-N-glycosidase F-related protein [Sandaracinaceae bacterium LLY-WYZ-13_1]|nr:peptide-N-glycosidase F-related protein [Sandaracinaceae bacterium LLY-WYZ-13_1]
MRACVASLLLLMSACDGDPAPVDAGGTDAGVAADAGPPDAGTDAGPEPGAICDELGLSVRAFDATADGAAFQTVAGDFTVRTLDGPWTLSERWSGCESYVFVLHDPGPTGTALYETFPDELFTEGPRNVHYFFGTFEDDAEAARALAEDMRAKVEEGFDFHELGEADRAFWRSRMHYLAEPIREADGSVGALTREDRRVTNAFAITRQQVFDPVGSLSVVASGGFTPRLPMVRFAAPYYDYLHDLDARLGAEEATVISLLDAETIAARTVDRTVTLPDAAAMAAFDALEIDVELTCHLDPAGCSEWDRIAHVDLCEDAACETRRELVRWITPYSRPGRRRWAMDASPLLGLLRGGGERTFRIVFGPSWEEETEREVSVRLRLRDTGATESATGAELAFRGGTFDADYNAGRAPFRFTPPSGTSRVELVVVVSGHGMEADNCAEWCNHVHTFAIGGAEHVVEFPGEAGAPLGCADLAGQGVPPGQWGNWAPRRAGWCPGWPVPVHRFDLTDSVTVGAENELSYRGSYMGGEPRGGMVDLSAYVVTYE